MPTTKQLLQTILDEFHLHHRLKASCVYDLYWSIADKRMIEARSREVDFYRKLLNGFRKGDLIFDVGANQGAKTDVFLRLGARVVAVEPDERSMEILREKFLRYRLAPKPVVIVSKAVSDRIAVETMWIDEPGSAKNTLSQKWVDTLRGDERRFGHSLDFAQKREIETTTLEKLITAYGPPFFVKIDVEGFEPSVLRGLQSQIPYLSFEVNLPEFRPEGLQCVDLLGRLAADGKFNYATDCQRGLVREQWYDPPEFSRVLEQCAEKSIEVFWKTSLSTGT
jgi:FkbM family methyltransferase